MCKTPGLGGDNLAALALVRMANLEAKMQLQNVRLQQGCIPVLRRLSERRESIEARKSSSDNFTIDEVDCSKTTILKGLRPWNECLSEPRDGMCFCKSRSARINSKAKIDGLRR